MIALHLPAPTLAQLIVRAASGGSGCVKARKELVRRQAERLAKELGR